MAHQTPVVFFSQSGLGSRLALICHCTGAYTSHLCRRIYIYFTECGIGLLRSTHTHKHKHTHTHTHTAIKTCYVFLYDLKFPKPWKASLTQFHQQRQNNDSNKSEKLGCCCCWPCCSHVTKLLLLMILGSVRGFRDVSAVERHLISHFSSNTYLCNIGPGGEGLCKQSTSFFFVYAVFGGNLRAPPV